MYENTLSNAHDALQQPTPASEVSILCNQSSDNIALQDMGDSINPEHSESHLLFPINKPRDNIVLVEVLEDKNSDLCGLTNDYSIENVTELKPEKDRAGFDLKLNGRVGPSISIHSNKF